MRKTFDNRAWWLVLPVFIMVAFNALIPLMTVVNYSVQETFGNNEFFWAGTVWFKQILHDQNFHASLMRQMIFTSVILAIQVPLGLSIALCMPKKGPWVSVCLVLMSLPLLVPWNVVGSMWNIMALPDIGLLGKGLNALGIPYNYTRQPISAWFTVVLMDVWHWTSLVVLLCYAGLVSIPDAYYQAAKVDGAKPWAVFRYIQLPKLKHVLTIAILLRFMDSFMIYTEVIVLTGGGPGSTTKFLSIDLVQKALGGFDLGPAAAFSIVYFLIILLLSWLFYTLMMRNEAQVMSKRYIVPLIYIVFLMLPIYWLLNMSFKTTNEILSADSRSIPSEFTFDSYRTISHRSHLVHGLCPFADLCCHQHRAVDHRRAAGGLRLFALPFPRRQAPVLLAAVKPHGPGRRVRAALRAALFLGWPVRHPSRRGAGPHAVQHSAGRVDPRRLHVGCAQGTR